MTLGFYDLRRCWYGATCLRDTLARGVYDVITIGRYDADGGCKHELEIEFVNMPGAPASWRVRAFNDALDLLSELSGLWLLLRELAPRHAPAMCEILIEFGMRDLTPESRPNPNT